MAMLGTCGAVSIILPSGETFVGEAYEWSLELAADAVDSPSFNCDGFNSTVPGLKTGSGSISARWMLTDIGQRAMHDVFFGGVAADLRLYTSLAKTQYYAINASLTAYNVDNPVDDLVDLSFDYSTNGTVLLHAESPPFMTISSVTPADMATAVATSATVEWTFSEPLDTSTVSSSTLFLRTADELYIPASLVLSAGNTVVTLTPNVPLDALTDYVAIVSTGLRSVSGSSLETTSFTEFQTA